MYTHFKLNKWENNKKAIDYSKKKSQEEKHQFLMSHVLHLRLIHICSIMQEYLYPSALMPETSILNQLPTESAVVFTKFPLLLDSPKLVDVSIANSHLLFHIHPILELHAENWILLHVMQIHIFSINANL